MQTISLRSEENQDRAEGTEENRSYPKCLQWEEVALPSFLHLTEDIINWIDDTTPNLESYGGQEREEMDKETDAPGKQGLVFLRKIIKKAPAGFMNCVHQSCCRS